MMFTCYYRLLKFPIPNPIAIYTTLACKLSSLVPTRGAHHLPTIVIPTISYLALGEKHADMQTFQVLKTWKV